MDGSLTYFSGLKKGENEFKYVVDGRVNETGAPLIIERPLGITGYSIKIGALNVPLIYLILSGLVIAIVIKIVK